MAMKLANFRREGLIDRVLALKSKPYAPSWLDRLNAWVERMPISGFQFYLLCYLAIALLDQLIGAIEGYRPLGENLDQTLLFPLFAFEAFYYNYLAFGYSLDALTNFQTLLNVSDQQFRKLEYEFAVLPATWINFLTILAVVSSIGFALISPSLFGNSVNITVGYLVGQSLSWLSGLLAAAVLVYRLVHQTLMVNRIYKLVHRVDLYNLGPIYALSSFMGRASLILLFILYSNLVASQSFEVAGFIQGSLAISIIALAGFVLPLLGINRQLVAAKTQAMQGSSREVRAAFDRLSKEQATNKLNNIGNTRQLIDAVIRKREYIQSISTWPWQSATLRNLLAGVLLPVMIWLIQQALNRFIN